MYSNVHDQLHPPGLASCRFGTGIQFRLIAVYLAARTLLLADLQQAFLRSAVVFVKYRKVSTRTVLPNFIGN